METNILIKTLDEMKRGSEEIVLFLSDCEWFTSCETKRDEIAP